MVKALNKADVVNGLGYFKFSAAFQNTMNVR